MTPMVNTSHDISSHSPYNDALQIRKDHITFHRQITNNVNIKQHWISANQFSHVIINKGTSRVA